MAKKEIVRGKTKSGFEFEVKKAMLNNAEFLELFAEVQNGDSMKVFGLVELALGKDQKARLYDHIRDEDGIVPVDALSTEAAEIFEALGSDNDVKN